MIISKNGILIFSLFAILFTGLFFVYKIGTGESNVLTAFYTKNATSTNNVSAAAVPVFKPESIRHLVAPVPIKALYVSSWTAGSPTAFHNKIIKITDETEINAVVIDVKDSTGAVSFKMDDPILQKINPFENRIPDIAGLIKELHDKNIYVIARIAVFEDPHLAKVRPDLAVKTRTTGETWKDHKGLSWADMGSKEVWDYNIAVARGAYNAGFDELNFDYIRFPSDGNMNDIAYTSFENASTTGKKINKADELRKFFQYLNENVKKIPISPSDNIAGVIVGIKNSTSTDVVGVPMSADLFGMTTTNTDDLNIGQVLENAMPYFDYIDPMVYPSHYPGGFNGYKNPANFPYEMIKYTMGQGVDRMIAASSSPAKLRPWLQDFNLGAVYTASMVRDQIKATYDVGLNSWLLWNAANRYTVGALEKN